MTILGYSGFTRDSRRPGGGRSSLAMTNQGFDGLFRFRDGEVPFSFFPLGYLGHDAAAAVIIDGEVVACAAEERFTRTKHALNLAGNTLLPQRAINYCLKAAGLSLERVDLVAHYCDFRPEYIAERLELLRPFLSSPDAEAVERSYANLFDGMLSREAVQEQFTGIMGTHPARFLRVRHHEAHAASAYFPSGFHEAIILTLDGTGEVESSLLAVGEGATLTERYRTRLPTSLGMLYLVITSYLGFRTLDDEYKVMGLASYGNPRTCRSVFNELVTLEPDGRYSTPWLARLQLREFLQERLGPARRPEAPLEARHADIAAALQESLHRAVLHSLRRARAETGISRLCLAGGVALNCTLNGAIARSGLFDEIFVQPAASDEGCSVGAALFAWSSQSGNVSIPCKPWNQVSLGPAFDEAEILEALRSQQSSIRWTRVQNIASRVADELARGKVVAWFQGRMEFGPRALGNRSILADPRDPTMKERLNTKVKRREPFRPFAPAVLEEEADQFFDLRGLKNSPFMLFAVPVRPDRRSIIPAVTHVDGTARVQTVSRAVQPLFWDLIQEFRQLTGVPVILNTSFNLRNEPIVCSPRDALRCFLATDIDALTMEHFVVEKLAAASADPPANRG